MLDPADTTVAEAITNFEAEPAALLYRLLWLALHQDVVLVEVGVEDANVPTCINFTANFPAIEPPSEG
jgi:hypothetical protein